MPVPKNFANFDLYTIPLHFTNKHGERCTLFVKKHACLPCVRTADEQIQCLDLRGSALYRNR